MQDSLLDGEFEASSLDNSMLRASKALIRELNDQKLLGPEHVLTVELVLSLSKAIGDAAIKGRASGMALASKELREAMALLPKKIAVESMDQLLQALMDGPNVSKDDPLYK